MSDVVPAIVVRSSILSFQEARELAALENTIASGVRHFVAVGEALEAVRSARLYRGTHGTFEAYCAQRWGLSKAHVYRLMDASEVVRQLETQRKTSPIGDVSVLPINEAQARELVPAPREQRAEVWQKAVEASGGEAPPAWRVKEILEKLKKGRASLAELSAAVKEEEAEVIEEGTQSKEASQREDFESRVGRARWHVRRAKRLLAGIGPEGERAQEALEEADRILLEDAGDVAIRES